MKKVLGVITLLVCAVLLVACAPKDSDAALKKLEKAGYSASWSANKEVGEDGQVGYLIATKGNSIGSLIDGALAGDGLTAVLYKTSKQAKAAFNDSKNAEGKTNYTLVGKWVIYGSEDAVKAFKK